LVGFRCVAQRSKVIGKRVFQFRKGVLHPRRRRSLREDGLLLSNAEQLRNAALRIAG